MKLSDFLKPVKPKKKGKTVWGNTGPWMFYGFPTAVVQSGTGDDTISYGAGVTGVGDGGAIGEALQEAYAYGDDIVLPDGWYLEWLGGKTNITDYYAWYDLRRFLDDEIYGKVRNTLEYPEAPTGYWVLEYDMRAPGAQPLKREVFTPDAKSKHNLLKFKWWVWNTMKKVGIVQPEKVKESVDTDKMPDTIMMDNGYYLEETTDRVKLKETPPLGIAKQYLLSRLMDRVSPKIRVTVFKPNELITRGMWELHTGVKLFAAVGALEDGVLYDSEALADWVWSKLDQLKLIKESHDHNRSLELDILENLMAEGPVVHAGTRDGVLVFNEVYELDRSEGQVFSDGAPADLRNRRYGTVHFKAPGYYSWNSDPSKRGIGNGRGDGSFGVADDGGESNLFFTHGKVFADQPPMHIIYHWEPLGPRIQEHINRMEQLSEEKVKPSYVKGLNPEEKAEMKREIKRFSKMDHKDKAAYPDDWTADQKYRERLEKKGKKLPKSDHTKEYERRYGK